MNRDHLPPLRIISPDPTPRGTIGKLEFPLPEENEAFLIAVRAPVLHSTLRDLDQEMRNLLKHGTPGGRTAEELAEWVRGRIASALYPHD